MRTNIRLACSAIALGTLLIMSAQVAAESIIATDSTELNATISTADFNLGSRAEVAMLKNRIEAAAADLCLTDWFEPVGERMVGHRMARAKCYWAAVSSAFWQLDRIVAAEAARSAKTAEAAPAKAAR